MRFCKHCAGNDASQRRIGDGNGVWVEPGYEGSCSLDADRASRQSTVSCCGVNSKIKQQGWTKKPENEQQRKREYQQHLSPRPGGTEVHSI